MKTWLTCDGVGYVYRHREYDGTVAEPEWIGTIELTDDPADRYFRMCGDNRTLTVAELQQILDFL